MMDNSDESIDTVPLRERLTDFQNSGHHTWTSYLNTISTRLRQFYLDHPPNQVDFKPTEISALHVPDYDNSGTQAPYYEPKDPARPHPDDQKPTPLGGYTSTTRHISDVTHQQRGRSILSNNSQSQPETPVYPSANQDSLPRSSHANGHTTPQSSKLSPGSATVPPGTARLREILTNLRKPQTLPPPNPHSTRPEGYPTGHDHAQSSDSDNDPHPPGLTAAAQIQAWIASQLPWSQYRQRLPTHQRLAYGERSPPHIVRQAPNQEYLWAHHDDSIDNFRPAKRMAAFHTSKSPTWSEYLKTLPAHTRRAYLDHPPMPADYRPTHTRNPHKSAHTKDTTHTTNNELKGPARPHTTDAGHHHQPPADHTSGSEGYKAQPRPATNPTPRKRFQLPQPSTLDSPTRGITSAPHPSRRSPPNHAPPPQPKRRRTAPAQEPPRRPYISPAAISDEEGEPWCTCCTAQLSDPDTTPGLIDPSVPGTRYRIRKDTDQPPTHSNQHLDYMDIFRDNDDFNARQRHTWERAEARSGGQIRTRNLHTSTYMNTPAVSELSFTIARRQFERYQRRGGRLLNGAHTTDHRFNSPTVHNMTPGNPYRTWFHQTICRNHYSLGEATRYYNQWLNDPVYGPDRDRDHHQNPYLPRTQNHPSLTSPPPPEHPPTDSSDHSVNSTSTASLPHSNQPPENRSQTIVEDVHMSPDDPNAVIDSGAMMTTSPRRLLMGTIWQDNIRPAPPGTSIRYGNMETEPVEEMATIGSYQASIVPDRFSTALVCVHNIVAAGHDVTFTNGDTIVTDIGSAARLYELPRSTITRVSRLHHRTGHLPADLMCIAVSTTWRNTGITPSDIHRTFYRQPCLVCVLAKRNKDSKLIWSRRPPAQPPPPHPPPTSPDSATPTPTEATDTKMDPSSPTTHNNKLTIQADDFKDDSSWNIGECISYDNVGPINPPSIEGYKQFLAFRDTRSKYLFSFPVKHCDEDTFLYYLDRVLRFFTSRGFTPRILRSDYFSTFRSHKCLTFYEDHQCRHETSAPYQQWQNAVERDIQTILGNVSATIHGQDFLRA
eukprot:gene61801-biopygen28497